MREPGAESGRRRGKCPTRQPRPLSFTFAVFDPLLGGSALAGERPDTLGQTVPGW